MISEKVTGSTRPKRDSHLRFGGRYLNVIKVMPSAEALSGAGALVRF